MGLPKCLDNVIRFQILSPPAGPSTGPSGEVSILTEPRILPVPASSFAGPSSPRRLSSRKPRAVGAEEGWEDGEDLGPDGEDSEDEEGGTEDSEEEGSWLEGRFQRLARAMSRVRGAKADEQYRKSSPRVVIRRGFDIEFADCDSEMGSAPPHDRSIV